MTDLAILNPIVLRQLVQEFTTPENLSLLNRVNKTPVNGTVAQWEIIRGARNIAQPNVPNSEANVVDRLGRSFAQASFAYLREKKQFSETTLRWIRDYGNSGGDFNKTQAEKQIRREAEDLNTRFDNYAEYLLWRALTGELTISSDVNGVHSTVDYGVKPSHKTSVTVGWATATPKQIVADVRAFVDLVNRDGRVPANEAYTSGKVLDMIVDSFAHHGTSPEAATQPVNFGGGTLLSDRMKDEYYTTGTIRGFMGLDWKREDAVYDATGSSYTTNPTVPAQETRFVDENALIIGNFSGDALELQEGLSGDADAPLGYIGKFSKSETSFDPTGRTLLMEWNMLPTLNKPDQVVYVSDVTTP